MAKAPGERYATAGELAAALAASIAPAAEGPATVSLSGGGRRRRRRRLVPAAAVAVAVVLATGGGWAAWSAWSWLNTEPPDIVASRPAPPPAAALGAIRVTTNPAVDILVDGGARGRSDGEPLLIGDVPAGERVVTLRLGAREQSLRASVQQGQTVAVNFSFPEPGVSAEDLGRQTRETLDRLRGTVDRVQRDTMQTLRDALDRAAGSRGGGRPAPKPEGR
jgi:hypothetical protein